MAATAESGRLGRTLASICQRLLSVVYSLRLHVTSPFRNTLDSNRSSTPTGNCRLALLNFCAHISFCRLEKNAQFHKLGVARVMDARGGLQFYRPPEKSGDARCPLITAVFAVITPILPHPPDCRPGGSALPPRHATGAPVSQRGQRLGCSFWIYTGFDLCKLS